MFNECIFLIQTIVLGTCVLICLRLGRNALTAFITLSCILANLFVLKQVMLCGLIATASDAFSIGAVLGLNLLQEYYDRASAQKAIAISFILLIFYCIVSQLHLAYDPCIDETMHDHYATLLRAMPRITFASLSVYILVQYIDVWLYATLKKTTRGKHLVLRNIFSTIICQFIDTVLFSYIGLYGIISHIPEIIIVSYSVKLAAIGLSIPFIALSKKITHNSTL